MSDHSDKLRTDGEHALELGGRGDHPDLVCLSHLRWNFVFQRPQHLMTRFAARRRVLFFEEPIFGEPAARLELRDDPSGVTVAVPHLPRGLSSERAVVEQRHLLLQLLETRGVREPSLWFYTPMAIEFARGLHARSVFYDCMDELSHFAGAPPVLREREAELLALADHVFTGGQSLFEAKRTAHPRVHAFPSSVDVQHFVRARSSECRRAEPADQAHLPSPRLGYVGVIDERIDLPLLEAVAAARPDWQFVFIGPVVKIDPATLPRRPNIHYLGMKKYEELPFYLAGWDVALMPFARNDATKYISPTKTPEYLAAARQVVSTSIRDVVLPYGERGFVAIADDPSTFVAAAEGCLRSGRAHPRIDEVDGFLANTSWDRTAAQMLALVEAAEHENATSSRRKAVLQAAAAAAATAPARRAREEA